jgi:hypothetical protein
VEILFRHPTLLYKLFFDEKDLVGQIIKFTKINLNIGIIYNIPPNDKKIGINMKKALLIVNLGTPDKPTYFSVFKYLRQFLMDGRVININPILRFILVNFIICPTRSFSSKKSL